MSLLAALVLALMGALGTGWIVWLRREHERDTAALADQLAAVTAELSVMRVSIESLRLQIVALRCSTDATRTELTDFVHGPPSVRQPSMRSSS